MKKLILLFLVIGIPSCLYAQGLIASLKSKKVESAVSTSIVDARKQLCQGNLNEAIVSYSKIIEAEKESRNGGRAVNGDYVAEYAYVLALSRLYDGALINIDLARGLQAKTADFFTGQILKVIGYKESGEGFESKTTAPEWISSAYLELNERYKSEAVMDVSDYSASLQRANTLSSSGQEIQALVILESLGKQYPRYYLPLVCKSSMWENMGNLSYAQKSLSQALTLYPDDGTEKRQEYANHLSKLEKQLYQTGESWWERFLRKHEPRPMLYVGGSAGKGFFSLNSRLGVYTNRRFTASLNFGYTYSGASSFNIGASCYKTWGVFLAGIGFNEMFANESNVFTLSPMAGLSFLNKNGNSSYDITVSVDFPFVEEMSVGYSISFGRTFYFDFNGFKK